MRVCHVGQGCGARIVPRGVRSVLGDVYLERTGGLAIAAVELGEQQCPALFVAEWQTTSAVLVKTGGSWYELPYPFLVISPSC